MPRPAEAAPRESRYSGGRVEGLALLCVTASAWGLNWPIMKFVLGELPPFVARIMAGALAVAFAALLARLNHERLVVPRGQFRLLAIYASLNYGAFTVFATLAVFWLRASEAVMLTYTLPIWTGLLAWPILGERPNARRLFGMVLALSGVALLIGADQGQDGPVQLRGIACGLGAAIVFAFGAVIAKGRPLSMPPVAGVMWQIALGMIPVAILAAFEHPDFARVTPLGAGGILYVATMPMTLAYVTWFRALRLLPASIAAIAVLLSPLIGVLSSAALLGDPLGVRQITALAITLTGVGLAVRS